MNFDILHEPLKVGSFLIYVVFSNICTGLLSAIRDAKKKDQCA